MRRSVRVPSASGLGAAREQEDIVQTLRQENAALKKERNELNDKLRRVQVQFQRLVADVRPTQSHGLDAAPPAAPEDAFKASLPSLRKASTPTAAAASRSTLSSPPLREKASGRSQSPTSMQRALAQAHAEIQQLRHAMQILQQQQRGQRQAHTLSVIPAQADSTMSEAEQQRYRGEIASLRQQLAMAERRLAEVAQGAAAWQTTTSATTADTQPTPVSTQPRDGSSMPHATRGASTEASTAALIKAAQEELDSAYKSVVERLTHENQELELQVKLLEQAKAFDAEEKVSLDPSAVVQLQSEVRQKAHQLTLLQSRLETSQGQMEMLKGECARLVEELKNCHTAAAEQKKAVFQLEHDKGNLERRIDQLQEVELALQRKSEEVINLEHELLRSVGALQSCNRETEQAVRGEFVSKVRELQEMRDQADASRRRVEKDLLEARQALDSAKRRCASLEEDVLLYKTELAKSEKKNQTLAAQATLFSHSAKDLSEADVHRAVAVAAIQRRAAAEKDMGLVPDRGEEAKDTTQPQRGSTALPDGDEANKALDLYDALQWDASWEQGQLREALAAAALDMELAESRCQQMREQADSVRAQLADMANERDTLLEENMEMRRRLTHVQTVFAKQQLQAYRLAESAHRDGSRTGLIRFCIRDLQCEDAAMTAALRLHSLQDPTTVFFSLDGLEAYEAMLSPALYSLTAPIDVHFEYADLDKDEVTVGLIQHTRFTFQLHHVQEDGTGSVVVAMAELPGTVLLAARETSTEEVLRLIDGDGRTLGRITVECSCSQLLLPVLLQSPLSGDALPFLSASEVKAAVVALRAVRFLRVQVFKVQGLLDSAETAPHRFYLFYTGHSPAGALSCVRDTVVRPTHASPHARELTFDDGDAVDHRAVVDRDLVAFIAHGSLVFVVFDECAVDVQSNAGVVEVPLRPLLLSPQAFIHTTAPLHPRGELTVGVSWVSGP